jgi:predicted nucleic acid-binding protein
MNEGRQNLKRGNPMPGVLIDTSAWIDFLRHSGGRAGDIAAELIRLDCAFIAGPVIAELLHGCRGKKETVQLQHLFPCVDIIREAWQAAGERLRALREKGLAVRADCCFGGKEQNGGAHLGQAFPAPAGRADEDLFMKRRPAIFWPSMGHIAGNIGRSGEHIACNIQ